MSREIPDVEHQPRSDGPDEGPLRVVAHAGRKEGQRARGRIRHAAGTLAPVDQACEPARGRPPVTLKPRASHALRVRDERGLEKWLSLEMGSFHKGLVPAPRALSDLLLEEQPAATTRGGTPHVFDRAVLSKFHEALSPLARRKLKLPATFFVDKELHSDAYLQDATAAELLRALGEVPASRELRDGKLWLGLVSAQALAAKYPGAFQFVYF